MSLAELVLIIRDILMIALNIYSYIVIFYCLFSFVMQAFSNPWVFKIYLLLAKLSKPAFDIVYMIIPQRFLNIGMISLAPIAVIVGINLLQLGILEVAKLIIKSIL